MSFEIYTTESELSFGEFELEDHGVNKQLREQILHTGLLTEELRHDPNAEKTQFSFTHLSFLEYFCALYIASNMTIQPIPADAGSSASPDTFPLLQDKCRSVEDVLRLKNVLVMVCGLSPDKTFGLCQLVYNIVQQDEHFLNLRIQAYRDENYNKEDKWQYSEVTEQYFEVTKQYQEVAGQYQQLILRCIREYKLSTSISEIRVPLLDLVVYDGWTVRKVETFSMTEPHIDHQTLRSLCIFYTPDITLSSFVNLETIMLQRHDMSRAESSSLAEYITRTVTLRKIDLRFDIMFHSELKYCRVIDLSRHEQLQSVRIETFSLNNINTTNLEYCYASLWSRITFSNTESAKLQYINICHSRVHVSDITRLIYQSVLLKHIKLSSIESDVEEEHENHLDLSRHEQLQSVRIENLNFSLNNINTTNLEYCYASLRSRITFSTTESTKLQYIIICDSLVHVSDITRLINQSVLLKHIKLERIESDVEEEHENHLDLSRHEQLQSVRIETENFSLNNINTTNLEYCYASLRSRITFSTTESTKLQYINICKSPVHVSDITRLIYQSVLLKHIKLERIETDSEEEHENHLDLSRHEQLETFIFSNNKCLHVDRVNTSKLVLCKTDNREVLSCVRNAAVLKKLNLSVDQYNMEVHEILLTLPQLHTLSLQWDDMSRDVLDVIVNDKDKFLTSLTELKLQEGPDISDVNRFVQTLPQLQKLELKFMDMNYYVLEVSPGMKHLTDITLTPARISSSGWIRFVDSLLTLPRSITVETRWDWSLSEADKEAAEDYLRKRPEKYHVREHMSDYRLKFYTVKWLP